MDITYQNQAILMNKVDTAKNSKSFIKWNSDFNTGFDDIDRDHRKLFGIFNAFYAAACQNVSYQTIQPFINDILKYTHYHFETELKLMNEWSYSNVDLHKRMHRKFSSFVKRASILAVSNPAEVANQLVGLLEQWLLYHIIGVDGAMVREIRSLRAGEVIPEKTESAKIQDRIFYDIISMNERLINRTFDILDQNKNLKSEILRDSLTNLHNRSALLDYLSMDIACTRRNGGMMALGIIDIDDFKLVNNTWGREAGDRLLSTFAKRLESEIRESDFLARLSGDEFVVLFNDIDGRQPVPMLSQIANNLHKAVESPFEIARDARMEISISMGLALFPTDAAETDELMRLADKAMYRIKQKKSDRTNWWSLFQVP